MRVSKEAEEALDLVTPTVNYHPLLPLKAVEISYGRCIRQIHDSGVYKGYEEKLGGKENPTNMVLGFRMAHKFKFPEGEGHKTVILSPTPTTAFSLEGRIANPIDTGEDMKNYSIYTPTGFFNHIERQSRKGKRDYDY